MTVGIGGGGFLGVAFEIVMGTYVAPTKFFPIKSEKLEFMEAQVQRRTIRQSVDAIGTVVGNTHIGGPIDMELLPEALVYFLHASRNTVSKVVGPPAVYTYTPSSSFTPPNKTLSITTVRNGIAQGWVGCAVSNFKITVGTDGIAMFQCDIIGMDEATQGVPAGPIFPTTSPMGSGSYNVQLPTASQVADVDTFALDVKDNAAAEFRQYTDRKPRFIGFKQRDVTFTCERDWQSRAELDAFKAGTVESTRVIATLDTNNIIQVTCAAAVKTTYQITGLTGQGDIIRATQTRQGNLDSGTGKAYEIVVTTLESV
jgi:hypothetical protein